MWNEKEISNISEQENMCKHCGEPVHDSTHILWHCCEINKHRKHNKLNNLPVEGVPKSILYGIPLSMGWHFTKSFWHQAGDTQENESNIGAINKKFESAREAEFKLHLCDNTSVFFGLCFFA